MKKTNAVGVITIVVLLLTTLQGLIPAMPLTNETIIMVLSAVLLFAVNGLTLIKNYLSNEINAGANKAAFILLVVSILGGLNDLFGVINFSDIISQWLRFGLTFLIAFLNLAAKLLFPTPETKSRI